MQKGRIVSVNISKDKGSKKTPIGRCFALEGYGLEGDSHGGSWHRQISLLSEESINRMRALGFDVRPGDFAENLTISGINLVELPIGTMLEIGSGVLVEITQIGKDCHSHCAIYYQTGDCIMPKEGVFARVIKGGLINTGDTVSVVET